MKQKLDWKVIVSTIQGKEVSDVLYKDLDANTGVLSELINSFSLCANGKWRPWYRIPMCCFYETKRTQILNAVLPKWLPKIGRGKRIVSDVIVGHAPDRSLRL
jgi:hypothetical protein